jgi:ParB family chromosome partitioning protein
MSDIKKQALGRGLSSLLGTVHDDREEANTSSPLEIPVAQITAGSLQPRHTFPETELHALSVSIQEKGVLQPILIRPHPQSAGTYEIVAGERRWRAAKLAHLDTIPALIREFSDRDVLEVGLLENLQRQDLDPIDEACGYRRLAEEFDHTQETLSRVVGKSRSHIANTLRLLTLPERVQSYLRTGQLSAGHGRAIIASETPELLAEMIIEKNLSVRQAETLSKKDLQNPDSDSPSRTSDPEKERLRQHLLDLLDLPVDLMLKGMGGKIVITFRNPTELDELLQKLDGLEKRPEPLKSASRPTIWS